MLPLLTRHPVDWESFFSILLGWFVQLPSTSFPTIGKALLAEGENPGSVAGTAQSLQPRLATFADGTQWTHCDAAVGRTGASHPRN